MQKLKSSSITSQTTHYTLFSFFPMFLIIIKFQVSKARSVIALRSRDELGLSSAEIARHVGVNTSSIIRSIEKAERRGNEGKHF